MHRTAPIPIWSRDSISTSFPLSFYLKANCWIHDSWSFCLGTGSSVVPAFHSCLFFFVLVVCIVMKLYKIWLFQPTEYALSFVVSYFYVVQKFILSCTDFQCNLYTGVLCCAIATHFHSTSIIVFGSARL